MATNISTNDGFTLKINPVKCLGCLACVMVCSFHHTKMLNPYYSSIEILRDDDNATIRLKHYKVKENMHYACDRCQGEKRVLCIDICPTEALYIK
ncbi:MAG TPA: hypothetical protein ENG40_02605 [Thermoprotei archaeon]|nr:hypothetical protein [Thermoprotei archaeon]